METLTAVLLRIENVCDRLSRNVGNYHGSCVREMCTARLETLTAVLLRIENVCDRMSRNVGN